MAVKRFLDRFTGSKRRSDSEGQRYDNVEVAGRNLSVTQSRKEQTP